MGTRIELCGQLAVEIEGTRIEGSLRGRQGRLLLAYLVLNRHRPVRRDELAEALWSESGEAQLAPPLSRLRGALGDGRLVGRGELRLELGDDAWVDWEAARAGVTAARAALAAGDWAAAFAATGEPLAIAERGLLPGLEAGWIDVRRAELGDLRLEALEVRAAAGAAMGGPEQNEAERAARAAVEAAPFRESSRAALMDVLHARGNVAEALRVFEDVRVLLREELGTAPGPALVALHERLLREEPAPAPAAVTPTPAARGLVERERELAALGALLGDALAGEGRTALIEGPAGVGKTRLLAEVRRRAESAGARVLSARGSDLERDFPFGVVRQLLEGLLADAAVAERAFAGAGAPARAVFERLDALGEGGSDFAALHGLYWVVLNLAAERPLVLSVDDLHWADRPSLRYLAYLARRLEGQPVLLAATLRTGEPDTDLALVGEIAGDAATGSVRPAPLSEAAAAEVVRGRLGADADDAFCAACHVTTGGNPLLLRQLLTALEAEDVRPDAAHADVVRAIGSRAIASAVVLRLARLEDDAASVARAVAVLGDGADLRRVAALAGIDEERTGTAAAVLSRAEILRPETPLAFVHPLVREAVYRDVPAPERERHHERAARVLHEAGAPTDQVAGHLLSVPPRGEEWIADVLHEAGSAAMRRGAAESAIAHLRRALEEPPPAGQRPGLLLELGLAEALSSAPEAVVHLRGAYDTLEDPDLRLLVANVLGRGLAFLGDLDGCEAVCRQASADLPAGQEDGRRQLLALELVIKWFGSDADMSPLRRPPVDGYRGRTELHGAGDRLMATLAALDSLYLDEPAEIAADIAALALADGELIAFDNGLFSCGAINCLAMADRGDEAIAAWDDCLEDAHRRGSLLAVSSVHLWRAHTYLLRGELIDAESDLRTAMSEFELYGYGANALTYVGAFLALARLEQGDVDGGWAALQAGVEAGSELSDAVRFHRNARLALLLADGRDTEALAAADALRVRHDGWVNPLMHRWRSGKAIALARLGRRDEALPLIEEELELARRQGAPGTLGPTLRIAGELTGAAERFEEAVAVLEGSSARLELAKALLALGGLRGDAAMLQRAHALAAGAGAVPVLAGAREALERLGEEPGPAGADALTGIERRVAVQAAEGRPNRDIAQALFLTPRDVERHLAAAAGKLGSDSRRALAAALAR